MIKDYGIPYRVALEQLPEAMEEMVWRNVAKLFLSILQGIDKVELQNNASSGTKLPPVTPYHLVQLRSFEFDDFLIEQED
jgi:hypothetical protein